VDLDMLDNKLTLMIGVENLINLKTLDISNNNLISLTGIENLTNLQCLFASSNKLSSISQIKKLYNLVACDICDNVIKSLLPALNYLDVIEHDKINLASISKLNFRKYLHPDQINKFNYWQYHFKCSITLKNLVCEHFIKNICIDMQCKYRRYNKVHMNLADSEDIKKLTFYATTYNTLRGMCGYAPMYYTQ
jgi:hypothetical protein